MSLVRLILILFLFSLVSAVDYCKLCENRGHTLCRYKKGPGKACSHYKKVELLPGDKKYIVDIHNDIRHHVASGQENRGTLGSQPPAADMLLMQWDEELAEIAQRWADQCIPINSSIHHDFCKRTERFEVGQNILTAVTTDTELPELSILILNWYKQVVNVIPTDVDYFIGIRRGKFLVGQYTQLVWAKTKYVGCGIAAFKEDTSTNLYHHRLVCNYGPAGNIIGQPVYQRGSPCSRCPHKDCDRLRTNLCQGSPNIETDTNKLLSTKQLASTQTNISIFSNNNNIFNTKIKSSLCLNPDEFNNTTDTKCITGIGTDISDKTKLSNLETPAHNLKSLSTQNKQISSKTSPSPSTPLVGDSRIDKSKIFSHEETAEDDRVIVYLFEASTKNAYVVNNGTPRRVPDSKHHYYPVNAEQKRLHSSPNLTSITNGDEVIRQNKRHYMKVAGVWHDGHCRCNRLYRSHSERFDPTYFLLLSTTLFVYLHSTIL